jgi:hypothetical protein
MKLAKFLESIFSKKTLKAHFVLIVVAAAVILYAFHVYSSKKTSVKAPMENPDENNSSIYNPPTGPNVPESRSVGCTSGNAVAANPLGQNCGPASVSGIKTDSHGLPETCTKNAPTDPKSLLPKDANSEFSKMNPMGQGDVQGVSLIKAGYHIGINTVGQSLRNANLQLRSEPANPHLAVSPWGNSTIGPDMSRRPLEIGCGDTN